MVELDKYLPVNREEAFRNGVNRNFAKIEQGFSKRDAVLENHQTNQKNAHSSKQIGHMLWDVEQELKYRAAQVGNLVIGANGDGISETKDARVAAFSKKAHNTLSERLLEDFLTLYKSVAPITNDEYSLNLNNKKVVKFADVAANVNGIIRSIAIDSKRDEVYVFQKKGSGGIVSRHTITGVFLDKMTIKGDVGSPISLGVIFPNGNPTIIFNVKREDKYFIAAETYLREKTINSDDVFIIDGLKSDDENSAVSVDEKRNELLFIYNNQAHIYVLDRAMKNILIEVRNFTIAKDESNEQLKGFKVWDGFVYLISGTSSTEMMPLITVYNYSGDKVYNFKMGDLKADDRISLDSQYAWGLDMYYDEYTNKISLVFGVTFGDKILRKQQLYAVHQKGRDIDHVQKLLNSSQNYAMHDGAGQLFNVPSDVKSLKQLNRPGNYYVRSVFAKNITDIPGDLNDGAHGYFVENSATNDYGVLLQKVRVYVVNSSSDIYERSFDTSDFSVGQWQITTVRGIEYPTYISLPLTGKLSDVKTPGEQYIASEVVASIVDLDDKYKGTGYLFRNSAVMPSNGRVQELTRNSTTQPLLTLKRIVSDNGSTPWKEIL